jgi:hypothetical protein
VIYLINTIRGYESWDNYLFYIYIYIYV